MRGVPDGVPVCLVMTLLLYQLDDMSGDRLRAQLRGLGRTRELHWVASAGDDGRDEHATGLQYGTVEDGELVRTRLGAFEAHGRWFRWNPES